MIKGETIIVRRLTGTQLDDYGEPTGESWIDETVDNVLFKPSVAGNTADAATSMTPAAIEASATFYFPRTYTGSLRGCMLIARNRTWRVAGDPLPIDGNLSPTKWNREVVGLLDDAR